MRKTKIICTLGPSTEDTNVMKQLMLEGMNVARFNFSHGDHKSHLANLKKIEKLRKELDLPIATLLDTKGPEIRIGNFKDHKISLEKDQLFTLTTRDIEGDEHQVSVSYKNIINDVHKGDRVLIDDGLVELEIQNISETDILCKVLNEGTISDHKGVNVPGVDLTMPFISQKDYEDILFGIENGYDFVAASFTRTAEDILEIRKIFQEKKCKTMNIIAKIENMQGVNNI